MAFKTNMVIYDANLYKPNVIFIDLNLNQVLDKINTKIKSTSGFLIYNNLNLNQTNSNEKPIGRITHAYIQNNQIIGIAEFLPGVNIFNNTALNTKFSIRT
jgi:hypothetical protein